MSQSSPPDKPVGESIEYHQSLQIESIFSGPLPPPNVLKDYAEVDPSLPSRIMKMAEGYGEERRDIVRLEFLDRARGQYCAVLVVFITIVGAVGCGYFGQTTPATVIAAIGLTSIVSALVQGRSHDDGIQIERVPSAPTPQRHRDDSSVKPRKKSGQKK
jgi:uncharacterized membrane protein